MAPSISPRICRFQSESLLLLRRGRSEFQYFKKSLQSLFTKPFQEAMPGRRDMILQAPALPALDARKVIRPWLVARPRKHISPGILETPRHRCLLKNNCPSATRPLMENSWLTKRQPHSQNQENFERRWLSRRIIATRNHLSLRCPGFLWKLNPPLLLST